MLEYFADQMETVQLSRSSGDSVDDDGNVILNHFDSAPINIIHPQPSKESIQEYKGRVVVEQSTSFTESEVDVGDLILRNSKTFEIFKMSDRRLDGGFIKFEMVRTA